MNHLPIYLVKLHAIKPHERHDEAHARSLAEYMKQQQTWITPVALERRTLLVMDGHHRLAAARQLGLSHIPCYLFDYGPVQVEARRAQYRVDPDEIIRRALWGELYPIKTTRHIFPVGLARCSIPLAQLQRTVEAPGQVLWEDVVPWELSEGRESSGHQMDELNAPQLLLKVADGVCA